MAKYAALLAALTLCAALPAAGAELRVTCYSDGNECDVLRTLAGQFTAANPAITIRVDQVPYKAILESLPVQLAAGQGPDIARVTDFGSISQHLLDLRPLLPDPAYWEANFGPALPWMRPTAADTGIYGLLSQLTVTGPYVNASLFEQAGVPLPGPAATWDDWAAATQKVAKATGTPYGMAWDRSGHRFGGPAVSYGAAYFGADGAPAVVDDGFKAIAGRFLRWAKDGTVMPDVWAAAGGGYRDAFEEFRNGKAVLYLSGSWQLNRMQQQIGDSFEWQAVPNPCGPAACSGMPGGAAYVALKGTKSPKEVAAFLDYLASAPVYGRMMADTANISAHAGLRSQGVTYALSPAATAAMQVFTASANAIAPAAYRLQGYRYNRVLFDATADRLSQAIAGQITADQAYERITADVSARLAAAQR